MVKINLGALLQIPLTTGKFGYAQFIHRHPTEGYFIRVIKGTYDRTPTNLEKLINSETQFFTFCSITTAVHNKYMTVVGTFSIPEVYKKFPICKIGHFNTETKKYNIPFLWDGEKEWPVTELTEEQKSYPW